ncbi:hypothetical protein C8J57DRAFT_1503665 [Mycena rebaudengoi]|nr:hypothetical protein C8J57DRAFT_1503665 [Mycena rebaudengoi]
MCGITVEYSSAEQMQEHASQLWDAWRHLRSNRASSHNNLAGLLVAASRAPHPTSAPAITAHANAARKNPEASHPNGLTAGAPPAIAARNTAMPTTQAEKRCFMCGNVGHIATNPVCPKFSEPTPACRFRATRVYDSYVADTRAAGAECNGRCALLVP